MANTVNTTYISCGHNKVIMYVTLVSDGSNETDSVVYDSSDVASKLGLPDSLTCSLLSIEAYVSSALTARVKLEFDATTDVLAVNIPATMNMAADYSCIGGLKNYAGSGKTGDIVLTTTGLSSGDLITIMLVVRPS